MHMFIHQIQLKFILCFLTTQLIIKLISSFKPNEGRIPQTVAVPGVTILVLPAFSERHVSFFFFLIQLKNENEVHAVGK